MKRSIGPLLLVLLVLLTACSSTFSSVNLDDPISIPEDGIIKKEVLNKIKKKNAIGIFYGESNGFEYEWTIFGSDLSEVKDTNLALNIAENQNKSAIVFDFVGDEEFGFSAVLTIKLQERWQALSATVYQQIDGKNIPVSSVSITGSKESLLHLSVNKTLGSCVIIPDESSVDLDDQNIKNNTDIKETTNGKDKSSIPEGSKGNEGDSSANNSYLETPDSNSSVSIGNKDQTQSSDSSMQKGDNHKDSSKDDYLSSAKPNNDRVYSDGSSKEKDKYDTDPVPEGKPLPKEPEDQVINSEKSLTCTFSIECSTILSNLSDLNPSKLEVVPSDGIILAPQTVSFSEGESVFDVLQRVTKEKGIHMESSWTPIYNSAYVEGIHNLYEFDCGSLSGWMYRVNGWYPNYGCSRYQLAAGDVVEFRYTCRGLGADIGNDWMGKDLGG